MQGCTDLYWNFFGQNVGFEKKINVKNQQKGEILRNFFMTSSWLWLIIEQAIHFKLKKEKITQLF